MLLSYIFITIIGVPFVYGIDHNVFKNCSRIHFCTRLRQNYPDAKSQFSADISEIKFNGWTVELPLKNSKNESLILYLYFLLDNKVRLKIRESNSTRFELKSNWALDGEPQYVGFLSTNLNNQSIAFYPASKPKSYQVIIYQGPPFTVEFYQNSNLQIILNSDRLLLEYTKDHHSFTFNVEFEAEKLYGLFDHAWNLALGETADGSLDPFRLRNSDSWGYEANSPMALYGSVPVIYGHSADRTSGIFLHNGAEQWIDISYKNSSRPTAYFMVESASFDLFVLLGPTPKEVVRQFTNLTGKAHLPQLWTLGYHQCRFSYKSDDEVKEVANLIYQHRFPMDAIWLDGDHTDNYRWFHWNHTTYTDPIGLQNNISSLNKVCVSISDPHIAVDDTYDVYTKLKGYFVTWENGTDYQADCWPGLSSWIDFFNNDAAVYYSKWYYYDNFNGSTPTLAGIWNDMNEPAIFNEQDNIEKSLPLETIHKVGAERTAIRHRDVHNLYGMMHTFATYQGLLARDNYQKRPFILSRSTFAGSQRVAAMWTGDNTASWEHFANSLSQCMTGNILGIVFCGADIGGFIGDPSDELLQRWYQGAIWTPFFRGHSSRESKRREPYLFSEDVQDVIRNAIVLRYKHIPYIYRVFYEHTLTGDPIISPIFYKYPGVHERDTQVLIGEDIMAIGVVNASVSSVDVLFPGSTDEVWYRIDDNSWKPYFGNNSQTQTVDVDIKTSPVFYRGGSVIIRKDIMRQSTFDAMEDHYNFYVNLDSNNQAQGRFYMDDFTSFEYVEHGSYLYLNLTYNPKMQSLNMRTINGNGDAFNPQFSSLIIHSLKKSATSGLYEVKEVIHDVTKYGQPLRSLNIARELKKHKKFVILL